MSIAIFGGTFNPPHSGHRRLLEAVTQAVQLDEVFVIPDRLPPHKQAEQLASGKDRLEMCRLAFSGIPNVTVSSWELEREGKSYSYYTVRHFRELYPDHELYFIMGSDMLMIFDRWYRAQELIQMCTPLCISRCAEDTGLCREKARSFGKAVFVEAEPLEISSTAVREQLRNGQYSELSEYLDDKVIDYIREHQLY